MRWLGLGIGLTYVSVALGQAGYPVPPAPVAPAPVVPAPVVPATFSQMLGGLSDQPATHTGFVLDRSMLAGAQSVLEQNGVDAGRAVAAVTSVAFDRYHYRQPAFYAPEAFAALNDEYRRAGFKHLVDQSHGGSAGTQPRTAITDLWLHFSGADIDSVTVLTRASQDMNVVQITGDLRPLDLLHLAGHFGIPKVDPNAVMVPEPDPVPLGRR